MANHGERIASQSHFLLKTGEKRGTMGRKSKSFHCSSHASGECRTPFFLLFCLFLSLLPSFLLPYTAVNSGVKESRYSSEESLQQKVWGVVKNLWLKKKIPDSHSIISPLHIMENICCQKQRYLHASGKLILKA